jgi:hypothetical protein
MASRTDIQWRGLEEVEGLTSTKLHWLAACGPSLFQFLEPFLIPTGERAEWIPDPTDRMRQMRVIPAFHRKYSDFIAISEEEPRSEDVPLSAQDLAVYRLDMSRFGQGIASALGFTKTVSVPLVSGNVARLGWMPTHGLDVVLVLPCRDDDLLKALDQVRPKIRGELALITPTNHTVIPHIRSAIDNGLLQQATLSHLLSVAENGTLTSVRDVTECFTPSKSLNRQADASDSSNGPTEGGGGLSHEDLSKQIEQGFNSIRIQTVESAIAANEMRKELEEISGRADAFLTQLVVGFGSNKDMANLFMRMLAIGADGKPLSYAKIGAQIGITKQAVEARFRKMAAEYPPAHRHLKTIRARDKTTQFSALAPKERRKQGVDESYDYDAD